MKKDIILLEAKSSFDYFWSSQNTNTDERSQGYGLVLDRTNDKKASSVAAVGFALSAYVIGVENKYITYEEGLKRVRGTLKTLVENVSHDRGFFAHFVLMENGNRLNRCEYSTIDTAIVLNGALTCDSYFKDDEVHERVMLLADRIDWQSHIFEKDGRTMFRMAYNPDFKENGGYIHQWDMPAEQLMMYILAAGNDTISTELAKKLYNGFYRYPGGYGGHQFIYSPGGALFTYQFSHAWFAFQKYADEHGFNWFINSCEATLANRKYCIDLMPSFKTFGENSWGLTACDCPTGYQAFGPLPLGWDNVMANNTDGTVAPNAVCGSIPFVPDACIASINEMYEKFPKLWGEFGFKDSYNLEKEPWFCDNYLGIDKGISLLMIDNYLTGTTWKYYMMHPVVKKAIKKLNFQKVK